MPPAPTPGPAQFYMPFPEPPRRKRWPWVLLVFGLLVVGAAAGAAYYYFLNKPAPAKTPAATKKAASLSSPLAIGPYYYVSACNAFTADDFEAATGLPADSSTITTTFATKTNPPRSATASVLSACGRNELVADNTTESLSVDVAIRQYPNTKRTADQLALLGLDKAPMDRQIGGRASFSSPILIMEVGNRIATITIQGYGNRDADAIKALAYAVAGRVSTHLHARDQKSLSVLQYPGKVTAPDFTYHNACALWGPADFPKVFGALDTTSIDMRYADALTSSQETSSIDQSAKTSCTMGTAIGPKAPDTDHDYAYVEADYYPSQADADAKFATYAGETPQIAIGDKAVPGEDMLTVQKGKAIEE
jgi:flagellar basal body-associated protein FliL